MKSRFSSYRKVSPRAAAVNLNSLSALNPFQVRAALLHRGETLKSWGRRNGVSAPQISLALHNKRNDRRSREIRAALAKLIGA